MNVLNGRAALFVPQRGMGYSCVAKSEAWRPGAITDTGAGQAVLRRGAGVNFPQPPSFADAGSTTNP